MCYWQRWPHGAAILLAALAFTTPPTSLARARFDAACGAGDRRFRRDRRLSCRRRGPGLRGLHDLHGDRRRLVARRHHESAPGPLRPGAMVVPRHFDGRLERHLLARRRGAHCHAHVRRPSRHDRAGAPASGEPDRASMLRVDQAGEYGATRIYAGPARGASPQFARRQADRAHGGAGAAAPRPLRPADGRAARPPDRAPAVVERRRLRARRGDRADVARKRRWPAPTRSRPKSTAIIGKQLDELGDDDPELAADIAEFRADELEHRDVARDAGAAEAIGYPLLTAAIRAGCRVAIGLSKRI